MQMRGRIKHHHTPQRASGSGRTSEATVPSGTEADDAFSPTTLETSRPNGRRSKWTRTFWYGLPSFRARPRRAGRRSRLRRAQGDTADALTESPSRELQLHEQAQHALAEIGAVLESSPSIALDREAPFGGGGKGSGVPFALSSEVGTQGKSRVRALSRNLRFNQD
eukprot:6183659-Pleurochrysis_carterae.AAC.1